MRDGVSSATVGFDGLACSKFWAFAGVLFDEHVSNRPDLLRDDIFTHVLDHGGALRGGEEMTFFGHAQALNFVPPEMPVLYQLRRTLATDGSSGLKVPG